MKDTEYNEYSPGIRAAVLDDSESISKLASTLSRKFITVEFSPEGKQALLNSLTPDAIRKGMLAGFGYHVAETRGHLAGVIGVKGNSHLYHLFVAEQLQRRGIAKQLWLVAMEDCLAKGNPGEFTVNSSSYALEVYRKLGFIQESGPRIKDGVVFVPMKFNLNKRQ